MNKKMDMKGLKNEMKIMSKRHKRDKNMKKTKKDSIKLILP